MMSRLKEEERNEKTEKPAERFACVLSKESESCSPEINMKSNSTGFSKLWRFRNEMLISGKTKTEISLVKSASRKAPIPETRPKNKISKYKPRVSSESVV